MSTINQLLVEMAYLKAAGEEIAAQKKSVQEALIEAMRQDGRKTVSATTEDGKTVKGSLVEPTKVVYDEARLKTTLGAKTWGKVTKQVLDAAKLEAAVTIGEIDANTVASCASVQDIAAHVRLSGDTLTVPTRQDGAQGPEKPRVKVRKPSAARLVS